MRDPVRGSGASLSIVGWLWADILLGLFALFLAANTAASAASNQTTPGVDPKNVEITLTVDPTVLMNGTPDAVTAEQRRIAADATKSLQGVAPGRKVAIVLAYGVWDDPVSGEKLAKLATTELTSGAYTGATIRPYHELAPGARGTTVKLDVYLFY
jgi:hypothetical protein